MKYFTKSKKDKSVDGLEELLSVSEQSGVIPRKQIKEIDEVFTRAETLVGYMLVKKGELVSNIMLMWKRGLGVSEYDGIVSPAYSVFSFQNSFPKYFHFLFRTDQYISEFKRNSTGVIESRLRLYDDIFGSIYSHYPPLKEQEQIAAFLDEKTSHIDNLLDISKRKIRLLREQKTSIINQVVTKGLNPNAKMKDSGVEWIGEIPDGWGCVKMKYMAQICNGADFKEHTLEDGGFPVYGSGGIFSRSSKYLYNKTSVLLGRKGSVDKPKIVFEPFWCSDTTYFTKIYKNVIPVFFYFLVQQIKFDLYIYGSTIPSMTKSVYDEMVFPLPPLKEQEQIVAFLDEKTSIIDKSISIEERRIGLLKEYRQSLISEVITGKIKVSADE
jgi:type I restriction enzyme S subunit